MLWNIFIRIAPQMGLLRLSLRRRGVEYTETGRRKESLADSTYEVCVYLPGSFWYMKARFSATGKGEEK